MSATDVAVAEATIQERLFPESVSDPEEWDISLSTLPEDGELVGPAPSPSFIASVRTFGLLNPVTLVERKGGGYDVAAGRRRIKAARAVGMETVPARVYARGEVSVDALTLIENTHRKANHSAEYQAVTAMLAVEGVTEDDIVLRLGIPRNRVRSLLSLTGLDPDLKQAMVIGEIRESVARQAVRCSKQDQQKLVVRLKKKGRITGGDVKEVRSASRERAIAAMPKAMFEAPGPSRSETEQERQARSMPLLQKLESIARLVAALKEDEIPNGYEEVAYLAQKIAIAFPQ